MMHKFNQRVSREHYFQMRERRKDAERGQKIDVYRERERERDAEIRALGLEKRSYSSALQYRPVGSNPAAMSTIMIFSNTESGSLQAPLVIVRKSVFSRG